MRRMALFVVGIAVAGIAQEAEPEPKPDPTELLAQAMRDYRARTDLVLEADVTQRDPEAEKNEGQGAFGGMVIRTTSSSMGAKPFEGRIEAWRDAQDRIVLVSRRELPGIGILVTPDRTIHRITTEDKPPALDTMRTEIVSLMDGGRLSKQVMRADLAHAIDAETGAHVFTGEISRNVVRPVAARGDDPMAIAMSQMAPRVLRTNVELRISPAGSLQALRLEVVRNDPMKEMMKRGGLRQRIVIGGGGGAPVPEKDENEEEHEVVGKTTVYALSFGKTKPSERTVGFKRQVVALLEERK